MREWAKFTYLKAGFKTESWNKIQQYTKQLFTVPLNKAMGVGGGIYTNQASSIRVVIFTSLKNRLQSFKREK